jgi:hypothetical protein
MRAITSFTVAGVTALLDLATAIGYDPASGPDVTTPSTVTSRTLWGRTGSKPSAPPMLKSHLLADY